jgi:hypothetical protein
MECQIAPDHENEILSKQLYLFVDISKPSPLENKHPQRYTTTNYSTGKYEPSLFYSFLEMACYPRFRSAVSSRRYSHISFKQRQFVPPTFLTAIFFFPTNPCLPDDFSPYVLLPTRLSTLFHNTLPLYSSRMSSSWLPSIGIRHLQHVPIID